MAKYIKIKNFDIANGEGIGVSIFFSGCDRKEKCKDCFNSSAWDFNAGQDFSQAAIDEILTLLSNPHINHLSILGGEPLAKQNIDSVKKLVKTAKEHFPNKKIWLWTWRDFSSITDDNLLKYIDVLVDGPFIKELKNLNLKYCGSSNQRVINVQKSLEEKKIILLEK